MNTTVEEGLNLPVEKLTTPLGKKDLIVNDNILAAIQSVENLLKTHVSHRSRAGSSNAASPRCHVIFTGPAGTGKTFAAAVLGQETGHDVYRIDLLSVISKYIGETEKNLDAVFSQAEASDAILFFDEADALFGKRTDVRDSQDRFDNIYISRLLQRMEAFEGVLILAFNKALNLNSPFFKRFNRIVEFERPNRSQRLKLWRKYLPMKVQQDLGFDVDEIARKYKMTGGEIVETIQLAGGNNPEGFSKVLLLKELHLKGK